MESIKNFDCMSLIYMHYMHKLKQSLSCLFILLISLLISSSFLTRAAYATTAVTPQQVAVNSSSAKVIFGDSKKIGNGKVRTWLKIDEKSKKPLSLGVTLTEEALTGLPEDIDSPQEGSERLQLMDGSPNHTFEYELLFPKEAESTAFTHMGFNWNALGHGPTGIFDRPHFDVHFYMATPEYRHNIEFDVTKVGDTYKVETSNIIPPEGYLPRNYKLANNTAEPRMGSHYADVTSSQLQPGNFDNIFLFGVHNGLILFWEPMITLDYLKMKPNFSAKLEQPKKYPVSGYYPTSYSVVYDANRKEFDISLDKLVLRASGYPDNVYGVEPCMDVRMAKIINQSHNIPDDQGVQKCFTLLRGI